jgi:hypothetical protein
VAVSRKSARLSKDALPHDEKEFRILPRRPPPATEPRGSMPSALGRIYAFARQTGRRNNRTKGSPRYQQRCAVRVTYVRNKIAGQWKAHGRYLARESATHRAAQRQAGFDQTEDKLDVAERLNGWQQAGDPRLWKIILSPEFGDKLEMQGFARGVMARVEKEVGAGVEWVAVAHYNTGHPHIHVAMRGIDRGGREIRQQFAIVRNRSVASGIFLAVLLEDQELVVFIDPLPLDCERANTRAYCPSRNLCHRCRWSNPCRPYAPASFVVRCLSDGLLSDRSRGWLVHTQSVATRHSRTDP